ncbi:hypothetical protein C8Q79DRAFT_1010336 [Trametes meyenii]|nr:hypothetical protein C8Q79DRAFT_1010336 [Trametes meyenii]
MKYSVFVALSLALAASARPRFYGRAEFTLQNGQAALAQNQPFASLSANSPCTAGQNACVNGEFAQCVNGKFVLQPCAGGLVCAALPLVNSPGTSVTCTTTADRDARIAATGAMGGARRRDEPEADVRRPHARPPQGKAPQGKPPQGKGTAAAGAKPPAGSDPKAAKGKSATASASAPAAGKASAAAGSASAVAPSGVAGSAAAAAPSASGGGSAAATATAPAASGSAGTIVSVAAGSVTVAASASVAGSGTVVASVSVGTTVSASVGASGTAIASVGVSTSVAAASTAAAASSTAAANDPSQSSLTLDQSLIASGFAQDGQATKEAGQVPSLTSTNNFINFCATVPNLPITNGQQIIAGSCNPAPMGIIAAKDKMPSAKFVSPANLDTVPANTNFTVKLALNNLETGHFVNALTNYFAAPQVVNAAGVIQGHSHIVIEKLTSLKQTTPLDPAGWIYFKGLNAAAVGGVLTQVVPGLPAGTYRLASINTAANHQPALVAIAQHGALDDMVYFTVQ